MAGGTTIRSLVTRATEQQLRLLVDPVVLSVLRLLDPSSVTSDALRKIVLGAHSQRFYLQDDKARRIILDLLSDEDAAELCNDLRLSSNELPKSRLRNIKKLTSSQRESLLAFFGIDADATRAASTPCSHASAEYALFSHQRSTLQRVIAALYADSRRLVLHMPTGSGKTRTAMHLVARHLRERDPGVVVWLALSRELLEQAASEFERAWRHLGNRSVSVVRFWGSHTHELDEMTDGLIVAGLGKLNAARQRDGNFLPTLADSTTLTVIDEAHQAIAPTFAGILDILATKNPDSCLLGLTATPGRTYSNVDEDARLSTFFSRRKVSLEVAGYDNPVRYLVDTGYLAKAVFRTISINAAQLGAAEAKALADHWELPDDVAARIAAKETWTLAIVRETEILMTHHRRVIVFATTKNHALLLAAIIRARGGIADAVTAETPIVDRYAVLQRYASNDSDPMVLFNFGVLTTGFDAPSTSAAIIARPTRSLVLYSQMVGRALRGLRAGGNAAAEIVTVIDPTLPGFGDPAEAFLNWEDVWE